MNFQPELAAAVMERRKTETRRLASDNPRSPWYRGRCRYSVGKVFTINPGRSKVRIGEARVTALATVTAALRAAGASPRTQETGEGR